MLFRKNIVVWIGLFLCNHSLFGQTVIGKYGVVESHSIFLEIKKDSTFTEINSLNAFDMKREGKWAIKADTLLLDTKKVFHQTKEKATQITDPNDDYWKLSRKLSKYLIFHDTLVQIKRTSQGLHMSWMVPRAVAEAEKTDTIDFKNFRHQYSKTDSIVSFPKETCYKLYNDKGKLFLDECKKSFCITRFPKSVYYLEIDKRAIELIWY